MKILSLPKNYSFNNTKTFEHFKNIHIALSERNWTGAIYNEKESCISFINELKNYQTLYNELFEHIEKIAKKEFNIQLLIDTSVFTGELPSNEKLLEFLEELDDFYTMDDASNEKERMAVKYKKKFRTYMQKLENVPYLFRWVFTYPEHSFSQEFREVLEKELKEQGIRERNKTDKHMSQVVKKTRKELVGSLLDELFNDDIPKYVKSVTESLMKIFSEKLSAFLQITLKNCYEEPVLFFYGLYAFQIYLTELFEFPGILSGTQYKQVLIQRTKSKVEVHVLNVNKKSADNLLNYEMLTPFLLKKEGMFSNDFSNFVGLQHLQEEENDLEKEKLDVLKAITQWACERIPADKNLSHLFNKEWLHIVEHPFFVDMGLEAVTIQGKELVGGPDGEELLIKGMAAVEGEKGILFPLIDTNSWDNLNLRQCALIAYTTCLLHDISIEDNYELIHKYKEDGSDNIYMLVVKNSSFLNILTNEEKVGKKKDFSTSHSKEKGNGTDSEQWVSFHFRRLFPGWKTSEEAKQKALNYGFKTIPDGFTFVDSFTRNDAKQDLTKMKISALDTLSKTLNKIHQYEEETVE